MSVNPVQETGSYIDLHMRDLPRLPTREDLLDWCLDTAPDGLTLEFGVGHGDSLSRIAQRRFVYGFDSFLGLPEYWREGYPRGSCAVDSIPRVPNSRLIVGLFDWTLPSWMVKHPEPAALVHVDSDLYSSAKTILDHVNVKPGTIILFDEYFNYPGWQHGEHKALMEVDRFNWKYVSYCFDPPAIQGQHVAVKVIERINYG